MEERGGDGGGSWRYLNKNKTAMDLGNKKREEEVVVVEQEEGWNNTTSSSNNNTVFVAVGKDVKRSKSTLGWAVQHAAAAAVGGGGRNSSKMMISILHVHKPVDTNSILGAKFPISSKLSERQVKARREKEKREVDKLMDQYHCICTDAGIEVDKPALIESASIEKGIVELIKQLGICRLVMGAASDRHYSRKMRHPKSRKAIYVMQQQAAVESCHIWFVCKGRLIHTSNIQSESGRRLYSSNSHRWYSESTAYSPPSSLSLSVAGESSGRSTSSISNAAVSYCDEKIDQDQSMSSSLSSSFRLMTNRSGIIIQEEEDNSISQNEQVGTSKRMTATASNYHPSTTTTDQDADQQTATQLPLIMSIQKKLEQAMAEVQASKQEAIEEATKRKKAEEITLELNHKTALIERAYFEELKRRKEAEHQLLKTKERVATLITQKAEMSDKFRKDTLMLETRLETSNAIIKEMGNKVSSVFDFLKQYRN